MKVIKFVKCIVAPVFLAMFLAALFRPLCMEKGGFGYLKLWWFMGIPFGIHRMSLRIIPKDYDIGGTVGILFINVLIGGAVGGIVLAWKLTLAVICLVKAIVSAGVWMIRKGEGKAYKNLWTIC